MDLLSREEVKRLTEVRGPWCASLYLPTHRTFPDAKQNPIRFKNLLRQVEQTLEGEGLRSPEAKEFLKQARNLVKDTFFWSRQSEGMAAFIGPEVFHYYRLPVAFQEMAVVTRRFHLKPLLPLLTQDGRFYVLALSQNEVRFLQCMRYVCEEIELKDVPKNIAEALKYDDPERQLQFHTRAPGSGGERAAMFHGQGVGIDDAKNNILRYFRQIDRGLRELFCDEKTPVVLASVEYLAPIYKEANTFMSLMEHGITGNPEELTEQELHEKAWEIVEPYFLKGEQEAIEKYKQMVGSERASNRVNEIVPAAYDGRVDTLFVATGVQQWGIFDPGTRSMKLHPEAEPGDEDLLDYAAIHGFLNKGTVYPLPPDRMPDESPLAALFRF